MGRIEVLSKRKLIRQVEFDRHSDRLLLLAWGSYAVIDIEIHEPACVSLIVEEEVKPAEDIRLA